MSKKSFKKKKKFQVFCRNQVKAGKINQPDGSWANAQSNKVMDTSMIAGYNFK